VVGGRGHARCSAVVPARPVKESAANADHGRNECGGRSEDYFDRILVGVLILLAVAVAYLFLAS